jgi:hypothetical protein
MVSELVEHGLTPALWLTYGKHPNKNKPKAKIDLTSMLSLFMSNLHGNQED